MTGEKVNLLAQKGSAAGAWGECLEGDTAVPRVRGSRKRWGWGRREGEVGPGGSCCCGRRRGCITNGDVGWGSNVHMGAVAVRRGTALARPLLRLALAVPLNAPCPRPHLSPHSQQLERAAALPRQACVGQQGQKAEKQEQRRRRGLLRLRAGCTAPSDMLRTQPAVAAAMQPTAQAGGVAAAGGSSSGTSMSRSCSSGSGSTCRSCSRRQ